jgi:hypothetical protein
VIDGSIHYAAYFLDGAFLTNAVPHFVSGGMGRPFQRTFAKPLIARLVRIEMEAVKSKMETS